MALTHKEELDLAEKKHSMAKELLALKQQASMEEHKRRLERYEKVLEIARLGMKYVPSDL